MRKLILLAAFAVPLAAQQLHVQNGAFSTVSSGSLSAEINTLKAENTITWLAYPVPTSRRVQNGWSTDQVAYLEGKHDREAPQEKTESKDSYRALLLLRIADHAVQTIRVDDPDRKLDAGGTHVVFLPNVDPAQSISMLQSLAESTSSKELRDRAVFAISMHLSPGTIPSLAAIGSASHDLQLREKAAFWLSSQYPTAALPIVDRWMREDKDDRFREKLTFDLSLIHQPASVDMLIRTAHDDASPQVRKQAQFWMATIANNRVADTLGDAAEHDRDADVRKSAVFGLSRLPNGEGTSRLIELARSTKDSEVRKQAVFWLGQSNDPRALGYLTQLVKQ
jgi:hypothetical protein